jgi:hypothetical protein
MVSVEGRRPRRTGYRAFLLIWRCDGVVEPGANSATTMLPALMILRSIQNFGTDILSDRSNRWSYCYQEMTTLLGPAPPPPEISVTSVALASANPEPPPPPPPPAAHLPFKGPSLPPLPPPPPP